ncbi:MAG: transglycosylase SLT domain-containing protein [Ktedonobacteraceae bacterium]|nr:transglycosylase SLT domain-containing protein [Ktedonobacteraceae bacterium]
MHSHTQWIRTLALLIVALLLLGIVLLTSILGMVFGGGSSFSGASGPPPMGAVYGGDNAVTLAAKQMAAHLNLDCLKLNPNPDCVGDASFDSGFPATILNWGQSHCPGCLAWVNNHFQCVSFVLGAYGLFHPLDLSGNGSDFYGLYATSTAMSLGYREVLPARGELPISPGDVMAWNGGAHGHVSIVLGWIPPANGKPGMITFAQANGEKPIQTLPIFPDGQVATNDGYWNGFTVTAYIHPDWLPIVPGSLTQPSTQTLPAGLTMMTPYVADAWNDATEVGIPSETFVRQIQQESGFNPNVVSSAGAIGIAQFMPATAAGMGFDPHDPVVSLRMAALSMAQMQVSYHGDDAKALAAYNAGKGTVQNAIASCGTNWLACTPQETQHYVSIIFAG